MYTWAGSVTEALYTSQDSKKNMEMYKYFVYAIYGSKGRPGKSLNISLSIISKEQNVSKKACELKSQQIAIQIWKINQFDSFPIINP